jgi:type I restriction-modification system R subunit (endonuclease)
MIGRGTRLCKDLFGPGIDKERFMIFDCYKNFEFFEVNVDGKEIKTIKSISESIFGAKVDIIKSLQHLNYQEKSLIEYRNNLIDDIITSILDINNNRFDVRMKGAIIDKYKKLDNYKALNEKDVQELKNIIAPLITYTEEEELSKRFDYQMYVIENAYLGKKSFLRAKNRVIETAEKLSEKGTIEKISKKKETITKIQKEEFWKNADLFQFEEVRKELRELVILLDRITTKIYYTDFRDEIVDYGEHETGENFKIVNKFEKYNKRVEKYLDEYKNDDVIQKLKNNIPLTMYDIKYLEKILWEDLGTKEEYEKTYGKIPLLKMVSKIIGMDRKAVEKEFSLFLSNENLNSDQINFVKHIVDYIVKNGSIDKKELKDFPEADKFGGLFQLFDNKRDVLTNIVKIIDKVNDRLDLVQ